MLSTVCVWVCVCVCVYYIHQRFACNGTVVQHVEYGEVIQLTGDQRNHIYEFLLQVGFCTKDQLKLHGF